MDAWLVGRVLEEVAAPLHRGLSLQLLVATCPEFASLQHLKKYLIRTEVPMLHERLR